MNCIICQEKDIKYYLSQAKQYFMVLYGMYHDFQCCLCFRTDSHKVNAICFPIQSFMVSFPVTNCPCLTQLLSGFLNCAQFCQNPPG